MKQKLTTAILSLVLAFSMLIGGTFAWFSITTTVQVDNMDLRVQTVGSLVVRTLDWTNGESAANFEANPRRYSTSITVEDPEDTRWTGDPEPDNGRTGLEPVTLVGVEPDVTPAWSLTGGGTYDGPNNSREEITGTGGLLNPAGDPVAALLSDSGHDIFWRATDQDEDNTTYEFAEERNNYGRWDIDMVHLDTDSVNEVQFDSANTNLDLFGQDAAAPIENFGSITPEQRVRDFLTAFKVAIFEITPGATVNADMQTNTGTEMYDLVAFGEFAEAMNHQNTPYTLPEDSDLEVNYDFTWYDAFTTYDYGTDGVIGGGDDEYSGTGGGATTPTTEFTNFGTFTADTPRYFSIVYYIDGNAPIHHGENQNHLSTFDFQVNIEFQIPTGV